MKSIEAIKTNQNIDEIRDNCYCNHLTLEKYKLSICYYNNYQISVKTFANRNNIILYLYSTVRSVHFHFTISRSGWNELQLMTVTCNIHLVFWARTQLSAEVTSCNWFNTINLVLKLNCGVILHFTNSSLPTPYSPILPNK